MPAFTFSVSGFTKTDYDDGSVTVTASWDNLTAYPSILPDQRYYPLVDAYADNTGFYFEYDFGDQAVTCDNLLFLKKTTAAALGNFKVTCSNDGSTWYDIKSFTDLGTSLAASFPITTEVAGRHFRYWRLEGTGGSYTWPDSATDTSKAWIAVGFNVTGQRDLSDVNNDGTGGGANDPGGENDPTKDEDYVMSDLSQYAGDKILAWFNGTDMPSAPVDVYVALYDGDPDDPDTPGTEITGANGLTRQSVTFGSVVARYMLNSGALNFGILSGGDKDCWAFALFDDDTAGNRLTKHVFASAKTLVDGTPIKIAAGKLPVYY